MGKYQLTLFCKGFFYIYNFFDPFGIKIKGNIVTNITTIFNRLSDLQGLFNSMGQQESTLVYRLSWTVTCRQRLFMFFCFSPLLSSQFIITQMVDMAHQMILSRYHNLVRYVFFSISFAVCQRTVIQFAPLTNDQSSGWHYTKNSNLPQWNSSSHRWLTWLIRWFFQGIIKYLGKVLFNFIQSISKGSSRICPFNKRSALFSVHHHIDGWHGSSDDSFKVS